MTDDITITEAAKILGVHKTTIHYYIKQGYLHARRATPTEGKLMKGNHGRFIVYILSRKEVDKYNE